MQLSRRIRTLAALSTVALLFAAAPAQAQAPLFAIGSGTHLSADQQSTLSFSFFVTQSRSGSVHGYWVFKGPSSTQLIRLTSVMYLSDNEVAFAGEVIWVDGTPQGGSAPGRTAFGAFKDNGRGTADGSASFSLVPLPYGSPTIQQIIALLPPPVYRPLLTGNVYVR